MGKNVFRRGLYAAVTVREDAPHCAHGPKLCLTLKDGGSRSYICSAFRNASACKKDGNKMRSLLQPLITAEALLHYKRRKRHFCQTCCVLFTDSTGIHKHHRVTSRLSKSSITMPSYLLEPLEESSGHAQYFFSAEWLDFMGCTLRSLRIDNIICVGAPRLFDFLTACSLKTRDPMLLNKFLLDLDARLMSFYPVSCFAHFNALNGHFFDTVGEDSFKEFMRSCTGRTIIFCDPPFGALMEPLVSTLNKLKKIRKNSEVFLMVTIPYFIGKKLLKAAPHVKMLDYKVTYEKHVRFMTTGHDENKATRRISVVRLFTDLPARDIPPPQSLADRYWFCEVCQRFSDLRNLHCALCNACTTAHGETYQHCKSCNVCRPPAYQHCDTCNRCFRIRKSEFHGCNKQGLDNDAKIKRQKLS